MAACLLIATTETAGADPEPGAVAPPVEVAQEPAYRDGQGIGGGGAADPASTAGTIAFLVSSVAVVAVIAGGILISKRRRRPNITEPTAPPEPRSSQE